MAYPVRHSHADRLSSGVQPDCRQRLGVRARRIPAAGAARGLARPIARRALARGHRRSGRSVRAGLARVGHAAVTDDRRGDARHGLRTLAHQLDRLDRRVLLQPVGRERRLRGHPPVAWAADRRRTHPGAARRVLLWRPHRGRHRLRRTRGDHRRHARGSRVRAHHGGQPRADRQHGASRVRLARASGHHARRTAGANAGERRADHDARALGHGRTTAAVLFAADSRVSGRPLRWMAAHAGRVAGGAHGRPHLRARAVHDLQLCRTGTHGHARSADVARGGRPAAEGVAAGRRVHRQSNDPDRTSRRPSRFTLAHRPRLRHLRHPGRHGARGPGGQFRRDVERAAAGQRHGAPPLRAGRQPTLCGPVGRSACTGQPAGLSFPGVGVQLAWRLRAACRQTRAPRSAGASGRGQADAVSAHVPAGLPCGWRYPGPSWRTVWRSCRCSRAASAPQRWCAR